MNVPNTIESGLERALEGYARLMMEQGQQQKENTALMMTQMAEQSQQTNKKIEDLTGVVQTLVEGQIKSDLKSEHTDARFDRHGSEIFELQKKSEHIGESFISLSKDSESNIAKWSVLTKIFTGVSITVIAAMILSLMVFSNV